MLNKIWFSLLCIGILYGFGKATYQTITAAPAAVSENEAVEADAAAATEPEAPPADADKPQVGIAAMGERLTTATIDAAKTSVEICIGLVGFMALWLGLMNIAQEAGLVEAFARLMRPVMRLIFPEIPQGHPAQGAVLMNLSANMLGLNNAATPLGLKAMQELQELNPVKDTATNSMAMFLAINTSSVTIIPMTVIGFRVLTGSKNPAEPIAGTLVATLLSTIVAIMITRWLSGWPRFRMPAAPILGGNQPVVTPLEHDEGAPP
jgi:spore maturation protein A